MLSNPRIGTTLPTTNTTLRTLKKRMIPTEISYVENANSVLSAPFDVGPRSLRSYIYQYKSTYVVLQKRWYNICCTLPIIL